MLDDGTSKARLEASGNLSGVDLLLQRLRAYHDELYDILQGFGPDTALSMRIEDLSRYEEIVIELRDLLKDTFDPDDYAILIIKAYEEGTKLDRYSPSLESVTTIMTLTKAAVVRIKNNAEIINPKAGLAAPEKVTLAWLWKHVPVKLVCAALGTLGSVFMLGVGAKYLLEKLIGQ